jgi:hypothetical protein
MFSVRQSVRLFSFVLVSCFAVFFIFLSCSKGEKPVIEINPEKFKMSKVHLSDFTEDIEYVKLDSFILIPHIMSARTADNAVIICTRPDCQLLVYDWNGRYLNKIGRQGNGPGEYKYPWEFCIDSKTNRVYVLNMNMKQILKYNLNGQYYGEIPLEQFDTDFKDIDFRDNRIYLFEEIIYGYAKYNWLIVDTTGSYVSSKFNSVSRFKVRRGNIGDISFRYKDEIYYWNHFNDSVFEVKPEGYSVRYLFGKGSFRITPENQDDMKNYSQRIHPFIFIKSKHILFLIYFMKENWGIALLHENKNTFQSFELPYKAGELPVGVINDLDGGVLFNPEQLIIKNNREYLLSWVDAFSLKTHVASDAFKNSEPKFLVKKKELEKLAASLNENDNPVLMLVKLKE